VASLRLKSDLGILRRNTKLNLFIALTFFFSTHIALAGCVSDRVQLRTGNGGSAAFSVEVVDTNETRAKGLMFRENMARFSGMLFVYDRPQTVSFWMRNTFIPLDIIFMDQTGTVARVHHNAVPLDESTIPGGDNIYAVLEINGGLAETLGIQQGAVLQHLAFDPEIAAWPCIN